MTPPAGPVSGAAGERIAAGFLRRLGYEILRRNCRSRWGEIDIVARDGEEVVFVEVKTRASRAWGDPQDSVNAGKRRKICLAAKEFADHHRLRERPLRFDVVAVLIPDEGDPAVEHFKSAFSIPPSLR